ncbi:MAG: F0F1 ATP synthase subunit I [Gammaproteobacteria bacterium]|nr:F0F1 ATP synthase subunit I [Gammaproteobacteria bacterium]
MTDDTRVVPLTLLVQAAVVVVLGVLLGLWVDAVAGTSALLGGLAAIVPNAFLAARLIGSRCGNDATALLQSARIGVFGKLVLTALLFGVIFATVRPISGPAVFAGFIAAQLVVPAALLIGGRAGRLDTGEKS